MNKIKRIIIIGFTIICASILIMGLLRYIDKKSSYKNIIRTVKNSKEITNDIENSEKDEEKHSQYYTYKDIRYLCLKDLYDYEDEESLKNGMCAQINDLDSERAFLSYFDLDEYEMVEINEANAKVLIGRADDNIFISLIQRGEDEYPKMAYGFKYSENKAIVSAKFDPAKKGDEIFKSITALNGDQYEDVDIIRPLLDYQEKTYIKGDNNIIKKIEYKSDYNTYGTYNSSGELYLDEMGRAWHRSYYTTSARRHTFYLYNDSDELVQIFDFGGLPYKGLEENPDIAIGVDMRTYIFER